MTLFLTLHLNPKAGTNTIYLLILFFLKTDEATNDIVGQVLAVDTESPETNTVSVFPVHDAVPLPAIPSEGDFGDEGEERSDAPEGVNEKKSIEFSNFPAAH